MELFLHIVLETPPPGVDFGLQKGSGNKYETVQIQRSGSNDLHFYLKVAVRGDKLKDATPRFSSPFIQGPYANNFIYIDIGALAGQVGSWQRRLKIPTAGITWEMVDEANANPGMIIKTQVAGTAKDGTPTCATVKPFNGWTIEK